jgi:hypothetical protein
MILNDMSSIKSTADYLAQIETLTSTNLQILKALNDSFFTKKNHIYAEVDDTTFVIPSFISLENKINMLQENFENLVKAPETSEAYFNFDGNTRAIEVRKYNYTPDSIVMPTVEKYSIDSNDVFKDFMTPVPYINLDLPELPNDIVEINVKKIVPKSDILKETFGNLLSYITKDDNGNDIVNYHISSNVSYADVYKLLLNYKEDVDFIEYDTIYKLPIRKNIGNATYVIESVISDIIDDDLNEIITLKLRNNLTDSKYTNKLTYKLFNETIEKSLQVGDELVNFDGTGKVVITEVKPISNTISVKVVNGEYLNFLGTDTYDTDSDKDIHDLSKLRFYSPVDYASDKFIKIPLEEDKYVFIAAAPLNSRMNVQSSWGKGVIINTHKLTNSIDKTPFKTYYDANVKNIGDVLFEMTSMITSPITKLSQDEFERLTSYKPVISENNLNVMQINKHLNNSDTVKNIRDAYNQKKLAESELNDVQKSILDINTQLSSISFDNGDGMKALYNAQLSKLNEKKNELTTVINNAIKSISLSVNSAEIPIENAKYRIRGFYVPDNYKDNVIGIKVQYRYKNTSTELGNATSINGESGEAYIYSDWNNLNTFNRSKIAKCENGNYNYSYELPNEDKNEPSYNQIDIPISQGESVDIRLKLLYDFGQPYINVTSDWSDIINIKFPDEFAKDVPVLTIIEENNNDIETNRFNTILEDSGVNVHIKDSIIDQNIIYYHKPDNIASGFYTSERRIIPLKDKLLSLSNDIAEIKSSVLGTTGTYRISVSVGNNDNTIYSDRDNNIIFEAYNSFSDVTTIKNENGNIEGSVSNIDAAYTFNNKIVSVMANIHIINTGDTTMKLYSLFPGNRNVKLNNTTAKCFKKSDYCNNTNEGIWFKYQNGSDVNKLQTQNQFITFRMNDPWTGKEFYKSNADAYSDNIQDSTKIDNVNSDQEIAMVVYPYVSTKHGLCIDSDDARSYLIINPGEEIIVPLYCEYKVSKPNSLINKTISFDLRTSLYNDPVNYTFTLTAKNTTTVSDKLTLLNKNNIWNRLTKSASTKHITTIK